MSQDSGEEGSADGAPKAGVPPDTDAKEAKADAKVDEKPDAKKGEPDDKPDAATAKAKVEAKTDDKAKLDAKAPGSPTPKPAEAKPASKPAEAPKPAPAPKPAAPSAAAAGGEEAPPVQRSRIPRGGAIEVVATPVEIVLRVLSLGVLSGALAARGFARFLESFAPKSDYPDDGRVSRELRTFDRALGTLEQLALVTIFAAVVIVAATHAILDRFFHHPIAIKEQVIRGGTFAIAMLGGAFATHQARHLSMDLISRRISPRARLYLKILLACFTIGIVALMVRAMFYTIDIVEAEDHSDKVITPLMNAWMVPIGGILIIVHTLVHTAIDVDYLIRRKTPPERMRSGH